MTLKRKWEIVLAAWTVGTILWCLQVAFSVFLIHSTMYALIGIAGVILCLAAIHWVRKALRAQQEPVRGAKVTVEDMKLKRMAKDRAFIEDDKHWVLAPRLYMKLQPWVAGERRFGVITATDKLTVRNHHDDPVFSETFADLDTLVSVWSVD